jgi:hypothetical protein
MLDRELLLQAALGLHKPRRTRLGNRARFFRALGIEAALGLAQPGPATLLGSELRGQLITARIAELLVLLAINPVGLLEDLLRDLLVVARRVASRLAFACTFVPSIAITPTFASPASAQSPSTSPNGPASAVSWRRRNRAIVV